MIAETVELYQMFSFGSFALLLIYVHNFLRMINHLTPELNPSAQRCLTKYFTGDFVS
jgi:hypothetical protein